MFLQVNVRVMLFYSQLNIFGLFKTFYYQKLNKIGPKFAVQNLTNDFN